MDAAVVTWAWAQLARPTAKLVLVAIASEANTEGECWLSLRQICEMTGLAKSSVAESLGELERLGRVARTRGKGGQVTRYRLVLEGLKTTEPEPETVRQADNTVREMDTGSPRTGQQCPGAGQRVVREADSGCPADGQASPGAGQANPPLKPPLEIQTPPLPPPRRDLDSTHRGGGEIGELVFPASMTEPERNSAARIVAPCNGDAQAVLDELAALMAAGSIRVSSLSCLRGLARRVAEGTFVPEAGLKVREDRERSQRRQQVEQQRDDEWPKYLPRMSAEEAAEVRARIRRKAGQP